MALRVLAAPLPALAWLEQRVGVSLTRRARGIAAVDSAGQIRGMVVYDGWTDASVQAHMAVEAPIVWRSLLHPAFAYPFTEAGRSVLLGLIRASNRASLAMAAHLGFRVAHRIRDGAAAGEDLVLVQMRREECRWLGAPLEGLRARDDGFSMLEPLGGGRV